MGGGVCGASVLFVVWGARVGCVRHAKAVQVQAHHQQALLVLARCAWNMRTTFAFQPYVATHRRTHRHHTHTHMPCALPARRIICHVDGPLVPAAGDDACRIQTPPPPGWSRPIVIGQSSCLGLHTRRTLPLTLPPQLRCLSTRRRQQASCSARLRRLAIFLQWPRLCVVITSSKPKAKADRRGDPAGPHTQG